jgi:hypothetical protein
LAKVEIHAIPSALAIEPKPGGAERRKGMTRALEEVSNTTSGAGKREAKFFIFIARNPLKSPDSKK